MEEKNNSKPNNESTNLFILNLKNKKKKILRILK